MPPGPDPTIAILKRSATRIPDQRTFAIIEISLAYSPSSARLECYACQLRSAMMRTELSQKRALRDPHPGTTHLGRYLRRARSCARGPGAAYRRAAWVGQAERAAERYLQACRGRSIVAARYLHRAVARAPARKARSGAA